MSVVKRASATVLVPHDTNKRQKVTTGKRHPTTGQEIVIDGSHATAVHTRPCWTQVIMTPKPNANALNSTSYFSFILENRSSGAIEDATLRFTLDFTTSGDTTLAVLPTTQWFERIEFYDRLTGTEISRLYGDMVHLVMNTLAPEALSGIADMINMNPKTGRPTSRVWASGDRQNFYLPFVHTFLNGMDLDLSTLRGDLEIRFYPRGNIFVPTASGLDPVTCTASLEEVRFISGCTQMPNGIRLGKPSSKIGKVSEQKYLDYVQYNDYGVVCDIDSTIQVDLDQFSHNSGALFIFMRKSGSQAGYSAGAVTLNPNSATETTGTLFTCDSLGDMSTIDLEDVHGRSSLGEGTPLDERFFRENTIAELVNHDFAKNNNVYMIPFTNDATSMLDGGMNGFRTFRGDRERLVLRTGGAPRESTVTHKYGTIYAVTGPTGGETDILTVEFKGVTVAVFTLYTGAAFAQLNGVNYTSTHEGALTNLNTVLAGNSWLKKCGVKIQFANTRAGAADTVSVEASAAMEYTATITTLDGQPVIWDKDDFGQLLVKYRSATAAEKAEDVLVPATIVHGKRGFRSGIYDISVYSCFFRYLHEVDGRLDVAAV